MNRLSLAVKFASSLAIVLGIFFVIVAMLIQVQTSHISDVLMDELNTEVSQYISADKKNAVAAGIEGIVQPTIAGAATRVTIVMFVVLSGVVIGVYLLFIKLVRRRIQQLEGRFIDICDGEGDLRRRIEIHSQDGFDRLGAHFNRFVSKVHESMTQVYESTDELLLRTGHVSEISNVTANEIMRQQKDTDNVATAMNQMTDKVQEVSRNIEAAAEAAQNAETEAQNGKNIVGRTVVSIRELANEVNQANEVIHRLKSDSEGIGSVLDVIRGIADQTNLLALNAAIEAARAGEQGRGFAVVADEVRTLAGRTQQSTEEIQTMIQQLQSAALDAVQVMDGGNDRANASVENATEAGEALDKITAAVTHINEMNSQISTVTLDQQKMTEDIDLSIININQASHTTVTKAQEVMEESNELVKLTNKLKSAVNQFKV
ncbi:MAG: HAMP domain-containing methyl-accepting chemotaxis protein [Gammaproteobacteria bacterium]|nr:HAMP domain-containing methyl-accepting chemotaxis protein [Gammaproteobacteria bacterium]